MKFEITVKGLFDDDYNTSLIEAETASKAKAKLATNIRDVYPNYSFIQLIKAMSCKKKVENSHD